MNNLFDLPPNLSAQERFELLLDCPGLRIERIISIGQTTPVGQWYDQAQDEWVVLLQGNAILGYEDGTQQPLNSGDYVFLPAHQKHRVEYTSAEPPCIWLAIHGDLH